MRDEERPSLPMFVALEWFAIPRAWQEQRQSGLLPPMQCVSVHLDQDTDDFAHLIGQGILIDQHLYLCHAVERNVHSPPWRQGESIALAVTPIAEIQQPQAEQEEEPV